MTLAELVGLKEVTLKIGGVMIPNFEELSIEDEGIRWPSRLMINYGSPRTPFVLFRRTPQPKPRHGASFATLMRRVIIGGLKGRKGRSAWRRLLALPDAVWVHELTK